jgi:hypothetical protein
LKLKHNGSATQIDHLLINQFLDIYLLESKNYTYNLKISADGDFMVFDGRHYQSVESPLEENEKRIQVLRNLLIENRIIPRRMGISFKPRIEPFVLVSRKSNVLRPPVSLYDTSSIISVDFLITTLLKQVERIKRLCIRLKRLPKAIKSDRLSEVAGNLASFNQPHSLDYQQLLGPDESDETPGICMPDKHDTGFCDYAI